MRVRARSEQSAEEFSLEETQFLKRKSVDTFNASDSRQSHQAPHKKADDFCYLLFYFEEFVGLTEPNEAKPSNGFGGFPYVLSVAKFG